jgi:hypothetical protein
MEPDMPSLDILRHIQKAGYTGARAFYMPWWPCCAGSIPAPSETNPLSG